MNYRTLGRTAIEVSTVCLGCYPFEGGATWGAQDENASIATIEAALEAGVTFFDTAEAYGDGYSEELLGSVVSRRRDDVVIATKANPNHLTAASLRAACEGSLRRLRTDYIDLYQIHWPNREVPLEETIDVLEELKEEGKVRAVGVSNFGVEDLSAYLQHSHPESNQLPYNLLWRAIEIDIVPACVEHDVGVLTYSSLMQGLLTGKYQAADDVPTGRARTRHYSGDRPAAKHGEPGLEAETFAAVAQLGRIAVEAGYPLNQLAVAWLLRRPAVTSVLVGARTPQQILGTIPGGALAAPSQVFDQLTAATDELKEKLGPDPDMWQSASRFR